jgi:Tol biopolymer transport system component
MKKALLLVVLATTSVWAVQLGDQDIFEAVRNGTLATVAMLLEKNPGLVNEPDRYTLAPLHWAAMNGQREMAELLLANGARINQRTRLNQTALELAQHLGHPALADWLKGKGADPTPGKWPSIKGPYLGEKTPGPTPALFSPLIVSSILWDHGAPAISADGREIYWSVVYDDDTGCIMGMKMVAGEWQRLDVVSFSQRRFRDVAPVLSADDRKLYFTSCRPGRSGGKAGEYNMWLSERQGDGWSEPRLLAPQIASGEDARLVFPTAGVLYFGSWRAGSIKGCNIFRSEQAGGRFADPVRLDAAFNTDNAVPTWVSADERRVIFESFRPGGLGGSDFWISFRRADGSWGEALNLGDKINSKGNDWFGGFSPDGDYFFFVSDRSGSNDVYWVDARIITELGQQGLRGPYLGQRAPGMTPEPFAPGIVSTPAYEHGAPAFSPDGKELYWSVFYEEEFKQKIFFTRLENGSWSRPLPASFENEEYLDGNPVFSHDGNRIYFTSNRPLNGDGEARDKFLWVWFAERTSNGWSVPLPLKATFDDVALMSAPSFDKNGTMYFTPWQGGGMTSGHIHSSANRGGVYRKPEHLGSAINSGDYQAYPYVPPDGGYMIFEAQRTDSFGGDDLYVSFRKPDGGWTEAVNMGGTINSRKSDRCPTVTPDGSFLFYISNRSGNYDYYWVDASVVEGLRPGDAEEP